MRYRDEHNRTGAQKGLKEMKNDDYGGDRSIDGGSGRMPGSSGCLWVPGLVAGAAPGLAPRNQVKPTPGVGHEELGEILYAEHF
ncbi:hypothetical protein AND_002892 [Anopheles darlingi]|uniref:Uncharacterized protein n=1 Tax=Anopheles darlingi TaxID=43151 RepID=W5JPW6_ANODA|nr:hypothetical protein AND_002892 [Anopheles darlingi]